MFLFAFAGGQSLALISVFSALMCPGMLSQVVRRSLRKPIVTGLFLDIAGSLSNEFPSGDGGSQTSVVQPMVLLL